MTERGKDPNEFLSSLASDLIIINSITIAFLGVLSSSYFSIVLGGLENVAFSTFGIIFIVAGILGNILTCFWAILLLTYTKTTLYRGEAVSDKKVAWDIGLTAQGIIFAFSNTIVLIFLAATSKKITIPQYASTTDYQLGSFAVMILIAIALTGLSFVLTYITRPLFASYLLKNLEETLEERKGDWYLGVWFLLFHAAWIMSMISIREQTSDKFSDFLTYTGVFLGVGGWALIIVTIYVLVPRIITSYVKKESKPRVPK